MCTEEVIVHLGEESSTGFGSFLESQASSVQAEIFYNDKRDKEKLRRFRACCKSKKSHKVSEGKLKSSYAIDVFYLIRSLAGHSDLEQIPPFDQES